MINGRINETNCRHIASMVSVSGSYEFGEVGKFLGRFWPDLSEINEMQIGTTLSHLTEGRNFHLLACYSREWDEKTKMPGFLEQCLNKLQIPEGETIALQVSDYHPSKKTDEIVCGIYEILGAIARSKVSAVVYRY